jgi:predicted negative regulator of RcsB-dependent stress response
MTVSEAATRLFSDAAVATPEEAPASSSSGKKAAAVLVAMLLTLGAAGALGYTQWWIPRQEAQQTAQLKYEQCLREVKAYRHKHSYKARLAQCERIPHQLTTPTT